MKEKELKIVERLRKSVERTRESDAHRVHMHVAVKKDKKNFALFYGNNFCDELVLMHLLAARFQ